MIGVLTQKTLLVEKAVDRLRQHDHPLGLERRIAVDIRRENLCPFTGEETAVALRWPRRHAGRYGPGLHVGHAGLFRHHPCSRCVLKAGHGGGFDRKEARVE